VFGSGGTFVPMAHEVDDGADTVAWLREQPWFDGRFATVGGSYPGFTQWALLLGRPGRVRAPLRGRQPDPAAGLRRLVPALGAQPRTDDDPATGTGPAPSRRRIDLAASRLLLPSRSDAPGIRRAFGRAAFVACPDELRRRSAHSHCSIRRVGPG
jgi:hypothetical protein